MQSTWGAPSTATRAEVPGTQTVPVRSLVGPGSRGVGRRHEAEHDGGQDVWRIGTRYAVPVECRHTPAAPAVGSISTSTSSHAGRCASYRAGSSATVAVGPKVRPRYSVGARSSAGVESCSPRSTQRYCGHKVRGRRGRIPPGARVPHRVEAVDVGPHRRRPRRERGAHRRVCGHPSRSHGAAPARARCDDGVDAPALCHLGAARDHRAPRPARQRDEECEVRGCVSAVCVETLAAHCRPRMTPRVALGV